ncbi:MAG: hypothetical protein J6B43_11145 [Lachnospiraceae bacterium]|nr:hypothetical protein [Lachnospiraceae bacterium]
MSETVELLSITEYNTIGEMLLNLIAECPYIPEGITPQYQNIGTAESIGVYTLPGAKYLKKNVLGGFTAQVKFQVAYKSFPAGNGDRINSQSVVDQIMEWLEKVNELPALSGNRVITKITASNSVAYKDVSGEDKSITFAADAVMEYEAE